MQHRPIFYSSPHMSILTIKIQCQYVCYIYHFWANGPSTHAGAQEHPPKSTSSPRHMHLHTCNCEPATRHPHPCTHLNLPSARASIKDCLEGGLFSVKAYDLGSKTDHSSDIENRHLRYNVIWWGSYDISQGNIWYFTNLTVLCDAQLCWFQENCCGHNVILVASCKNFLKKMIMHNFHAERTWLGAINFSRHKRICCSKKFFESNPKGIAPRKKFEPV